MTPCASLRLEVTFEDLSKEVIVLEEDRAELARVVEEVCRVRVNQHCRGEVPHKTIWQV
jgi:hypothetical protein